MHAREAKPQISLVGLVFSSASVWCQHVQVSPCDQGEHQRGPSNALAAGAAGLCPRAWHPCRPGTCHMGRCCKDGWVQGSCPLINKSEETYHMAEQSKFTKSHLWGLKLNESANCQGSMEAKRRHFSY